MYSPFAIVSAYAACDVASSFLHAMIVGNVQGGNCPDACSLSAVVRCSTSLGVAHDYI